MKKIIILISLSLFALKCSALLSIAVINGYGNQSWYYASGYESQKLADEHALEGCRVLARTNGLSNLANKCSIVTRGKAPGFGAISCGVDGCIWTSGYPDRQEAINEAYKACSEKYKDCNSKDLTVWEDFVGFKETKTKKDANPANCIPKSNTRQCSSRCSNGDCIVTYTNGCKVRLKVQPSLNPINNQWEYPAPSC